MEHTEKSVQELLAKISDLRHMQEQEIARAQQKMFEAMTPPLREYIAEIEAGRDENVAGWQKVIDEYIVLAKQGALQLSKTIKVDDGSLVYSPPRKDITLDNAQTAMRMIKASLERLIMNIKEQSEPINPTILLFHLMAIIDNCNLDPFLTDKKPSVSLRWKE